MANKDTGAVPRITATRRSDGTFRVCCDRCGPLGHHIRGVHVLELRSDHASAHRRGLARAA